MPLHDKFGRQITDLRISVTDRCNFRCVYCRSADPENYRDHDEILSWPELDRLAGVFLNLGIRKIRITGGEPLVREGVEDYIARLHALGVEDLSMTTNGHLLAERCDRLIRAGLRRINISLDSLDPAKFEKITRTKSFATVMNSIDAAQHSRLAPAKVNAVLVRGINDDEVEAFAAFARERGVIMRFIEFMPLDADRHWNRNLVVPAAEVHRRIHARWPLQQIPRFDRSGHSAVLRPLFAHPPDCRRKAADLPLQQRRPRSARAAPGRRDERRSRHLYRVCGCGKRRGSPHQ